MEKVTVDQICEQLVQLRAMMVHRMRASTCSPMMYNEIRTHVQQIDAELDRQKYRGTLAPLPVRTWTREQRRKHMRAAGNTFTQRVIKKTVGGNFPYTEERDE